MIKWCAFCQRFQGEVPPYERLDMSHGLCLQCSETALNLTSEQEERIERLGEFSRRFWNAGFNRDQMALIELIQEAIFFGIRPIDLLYGIAAPAMGKIGDLWAKNQITVQEEHRFTNICKSFIDLIAQQIPPVIGPPRIFLANVPENEHGLGLRFTELGLHSMGLACEVVPVGSSLREILDRVKMTHPETVGLSVSLGEQLPILVSTIQALIATLGMGIRVIVSGAAVIKSGLISHENLPQNVILMAPTFGPSERAQFLGDQSKKGVQFGT